MALLKAKGTLVLAIRRPLRQTKTRARAVSVISRNPIYKYNIVKQPQMYLEATSFIAHNVLNVPDNGMLRAQK